MLKTSSESFNIEYCLETHTFDFQNIFELYNWILFFQITSTTCQLRMLLVGSFNGATTLENSSAVS